MNHPNSNAHMTSPWGNNVSPWQTNPHTAGYNAAAMNYPPVQAAQYPYPAGGDGYMPQQQGGTYPPIPSGGMIPGVPDAQTAGEQVPGMLPVQQSYIENILRLNLGKMATIYMTFENNKEWNAKVFKGRLEAAGRDHIIISDPATGKRYLLLMINLDYITFDEELNYAYPYPTPAVPGED